MSFDLFMQVIKEQLPSSKEDVDLLLYHLSPVMKKVAKSDSDRELIRSFIAEIQ